MNEVDAAIYSLLKNDATLVALLATTTSVYNTIALAGAARPYVIFQEQGGGPENINAQNFENLVYTVQAVSDVSKKEAASIDAQLRALLHRTAGLTISGWTTLQCVRESNVAYAETTGEGYSIWHVGGTYRIRL